MRQLALLGLLAAGFVAVIAQELEGLTAAEVPSLAAPRRPPSTVPRAMPDGNEGRPTRNLVAQCLARPLFSPSRRPAPETAATAGNSAATLPRLAGILISAGDRQAIFVSGERTLVVREGGSIGGFVLQSIGQEQVTLAGPSGPRLLRPSFSATDAAGGKDNAASRPAAGTAAAFAANPAPSGLDILRNAERQASEAAASTPADRPAAGVDVTGAGPGLPGRVGANPIR